MMDSPVESDVFHPVVFSIADGPTVCDSPFSSCIAQRCCVDGSVPYSLHKCGLTAALLIVTYYSEHWKHEVKKKKGLLVRCYLKLMVLRLNDFSVLQCVCDFIQKLPERKLAIQQAPGCPVIHFVHRYSQAWCQQCLVKGQKWVQIQHCVNLRSLFDNALRSSN